MNEPLLTFNEDTDSPEDLRRRIVAAIDDKPLVTQFFLDFAFPPDGEQRTEIEKFLDSNGFALLRLPLREGHPSKKHFQFIRASELSEGFQFRVIHPAQSAKQKPTDSDPLATEKGLLENLWTGVEMEVRTKKFARVRFNLFRSLFLDAGGDELTSILHLAELSKARGLSVVMRRTANELVFRKHFPQVEIETVERASGEAVCSDCRMILYDHPETPLGAGIRLDCDGRAWKL